MPKPKKPRRRKSCCTCRPFGCWRVATGEQRWRYIEAEHPGGLGVDDQLDFDRYASVRLAAFVTAPSDQQPLKCPVVVQLVRIGWPRSLGLRARSQPTF